MTIFNAAALLMGLISPTALAAHAIAIQIASIAFMVPLGLGQAVTVRVGRAFGAGDRDGIALAGWTSFVLAMGFMVLTAHAMIAAPVVLISAFVDVGAPANAPVVAFAVTFLAFAALFQLADGAQAVASGMLRGLHDTRWPMVFAAIGYWGFGLPLGALLAFRFGHRRGRAFGSASPPASSSSPCMMMWRWMRRESFIAPALAAAYER